MILQALQAYYDRSGELAAPGWERKRIPYLIEITADGEFVQLTSMRHGPKTGDVTSSLVPKGEVRAGTKAYERPNFLWDHTGFVLGHARSDAASDRRTSELQFAHFKQRVREMADQLPGSKALKAIRRFYDNDAHLQVRSSPLWSECAAIPGCNVTFRLIDQIDIAALEPEVRDLVDHNASDAEGESASAICLVSGENDLIQRLHFPISGVGKKPAPLAAINDSSLPAFASFGKHQGDNFPVGKRAAFKYSTALNHLLRPNSPQKLKVADATAVFWAQAPEPMEVWLADLIGGGDDPDAHVQQVKTLFDAVRTGGFGGARGENKFYVLGLAPNEARIAIRFWHAERLADVAQRVVAWFDDLRMARELRDAEFPSLFHLLKAVALQGEIANIPPRLSSDIVRSLFTGTPYPAHWLYAAVQRSRVERQVTYLRAAAIKACLNRSTQAAGADIQPREMKEMLDPDNTNPGYRLGRLFAALEKIQEIASPGLNATIRERYYGAASSTPVAVFTTLMRLKNHHLAKLPKGQAVNLEKLLAQIMGGISDFPLHMNLRDQGRFAIGYYHQRQDFYTKRDAPDLNTNALQGGH